MSTTPDGLPLRPRGAERRAANRTTASPARAVRHRVRRDASRTAGVAVSPPVTPASTPPGRNAPAPVTSCFRGPLRRTLPVSAAVAVACLFVTVGSPQTAVAATDEQVPSMHLVQTFVADGAGRTSADRDGFSVVGAPGVSVRSAPGGPAIAARPTVGTVPAAGGFGSRWVAGCAACSTVHQGIDFAAPTGATVVAALPGRVVSAGPLGGYGNQVVVQHADGLQTRYGHLSAIDVRVGQQLAVGQRLGAVGSTGVSTGPHLHFEVVVAGSPVDPAVWLRDRGLL